MIKFIAIIGLAFSGFNVYAQSVQGLGAIQTEPTILTKDGEFTFCGFRFYGGAKADINTMSASGVDGSIMLNENISFLTKAGRFIVEIKDGAKPKPLSGRVSWLKIGSDATFSPLDGKVVSGETSGYHLFATDFDADKFSAFTSKSGTLWVAFSKDGKSDAIYAGKFTHSAETAARIDECLQSMIARVSKKANTPAKEQ